YRAERLHRVRLYGRVFGRGADHVQRVLSRYMVYCRELMRAFGAVLLLAGMLACGGAQAAPYSDPARGVAIGYPDGWTVDRRFQDKGYRFFQGEREDFHEGVAFAPSTDLAPGTVLQSDQLKLVVQRARPADMCQANAFLVDPPPDYFTKTVVDKPG